MERRWRIETRASVETLESAQVERRWRRALWGNSASDPTPTSPSKAAEAEEHTREAEKALEKGAFAAMSLGLAPLDRIPEETEDGGGWIRWSAAERSEELPPYTAQV